VDEHPYRRTYLVRPGDTLDRLASYFSRTPEFLLSMNPQARPVGFPQAGTFISVPPAPAERTDSLHAYMATDSGNAGDPPWIAVARRELGVAEVPGPDSNPRIIEYLHSVTTLPPADQQTDETPWCACFMQWVLAQVGIAGTNSARALSYRNWAQAEPTASPRVGALAVFTRNGGGHVGFYMGDAAAGRVFVLGGNEGNRVAIVSFPTAGPDYQLVDCRWPQS